MNGVKDIGKILSQSVVDFEESECMKLDIELMVDSGDWSFKNVKKCYFDKATHDFVIIDVSGVELFFNKSIIRDLSIKQKYSFRGEINL